MKKFYNDGNVALPIRLTWLEAEAYNYVYFDIVEHPEALKAFRADAHLEEHKEVCRIADRVKNRLERRLGINKTRLHRLIRVK